MITTKNYFELAQLAEASYAKFDLFAADKTKDALIAEGFSDKQATDFLADWQLVADAHRPNTASGFSSTLFQNTDDGSYVLAIRGTEGVTSDDLWLEDVGNIVSDGIALDQIVDLYNEWQRISTDSYHAAYLETLTAETAAYNLAKLGSYVPGFDMAADVYLAYLRARTDVIIDEPSGQVRTIRFETTASAGLGLDIAPGDLTVTGHSLGGHLAVAFTRLFPETDAQAFTVNGAGFATGEISVPGLGLSAETNIRNLFAMLGGAAEFDSADILNLYGDRYPEIVTDNGELGLYQQGGHEAVYIEHVDARESAFGHGGQGMTDSLAVYDLFIQLDAGLQTGAVETVLAGLKPLFEAASNDDGQFEGLNPNPNASLETLVNALADLFNTGVRISDDKTDDRDALYLAIDAIRDNANYQLAVQANDFVTVQPLAAFNRDQIVAKARQTDAEGLAYRYALVNLTPFAISGDAAIYASHNAHGELDRYDPATGSGSLTDQYLKDRAAMLGWQLQFAFNDTQPTGDTYVKLQSGTPFYFEDFTSNAITTKMRIGGGDTTNAVMSRPLSDFNLIVFGSENNDLLTGQGKADRLYGNAGTDTLTGNGGNDYLEGGAGFDTYLINPGDGYDTLLDSDGSGVVNIDGITAQGSATAALDPTDWQHSEGSSTWIDQQNNIVYSQSIVSGEIWLTLKKGDATVLIKGWSDGELGIVLGAGSAPVVAPPPVTPATNLTLTGDLAPIDSDAQAAGVQVQYDSLGNVIVGSASQANRDDTLYDSAGNDLIQGWGGNDVLYAFRGGDNIIEGGSGNDLITHIGSGVARLLGGADNDTLKSDGGDDWLEGNDGRDILSGGSGNDLLFADNAVSVDAALSQPEYGGATSDGSYGDFLSGGTGNDSLVGGTQSDALMGGEGDDLVLGGAGHDVIFADASYVAQDIAWTFGGLAVMHPATDYGDLGLGNGEGLNPVAGELDSGVGGDDTVHGGSGGDYVLGGRGDDILYGESGKDVLDGGAGDDIVIGGADDDSINGDINADPADHGDDYLELGEGVSQQAARGSGGNDVIIGGDTDDYIEGDDLRIGVAADYHGDDYIDARGGNDAVWGEGGSDVILAGAGDDYLEGDVDGIGLEYQGDDYLDGGTGDDYLDGGGGNDTLIGGEGADILVGGAGDDVYLDVSGLDTVEDTEGNNLIVLEQADGLAGTNPLSTTNNGTTLKVSLGNGETLTFQNALFGMNASLQFASGEMIDLETLVGTTLTTAVNLLLDDAGGVVYGGAAHDVLYGGAGNDTLSGHMGNDTLNGGRGDDALNGGDGDDQLFGDEGSDVLDGGLGNDVLDGGAGSDFLFGGEGSDIYVVDNQSDTVFEYEDEGTDTVQSMVSFNLGSSLENLTLTGTSSINATGNSLANVLTGNTGNNILNGGEGVDALIGGTGDDIYVVDNAGDVTTENTGEGTDTIEVGFSYSLADKANVENLTLTGTAAIDGTGNAAQNVITGNSAANKLSGGSGADILTGGAGNDRLNGGAGNDTLLGGIGNDIYVVNVATDIVTENINEGTDTVETGVTLTLAANIENLTLTGASAIDGAGNGLFNVLIGNSADNDLFGAAGDDKLDGLGGADTLIGGTGNDTFRLGRGYATDTVIENDSTAGNTDIAQFLSGVSADQIWFQKVGNHLEASIIGTDDKLVVKDWYLGTAKHVEQFKTTDGALTLLDSQVDNLVNAMASFAPPAAGQTTLPQNYQDALAGVIAANWQ